MSSYFPLYYPCFVLITVFIDSAHSRQVDKAVQSIACSERSPSSLHSTVRSVIGSHESEALLFYDFLLTFATEVERYWKGRASFRGASLWFFVVRYFAIVSTIPVTFEFFGAAPLSVSISSLC